MKSKRAENIINTLEYLLNEKLPFKYVQWLERHVDTFKIGMSNEDCLCSKLEWLDEYDESKILFVQDSGCVPSKKDIDLEKYTLVLIPYSMAGKILRGEEDTKYVLTLCKPKWKDNPKVQTIYGIRTTDDEYGRSSIKAYCLTYDIAVRETKNHCNWWSPHPVSEESIEEIKLIIE